MICYAVPILARISVRLSDAVHQNGSKMSFFVRALVFDRVFRNNRSTFALLQ